MPPWIQVSSMSSSATSAKKLISMMATFMASLPPSMVPRAIAPIRFSSLCSSSLGMTTLPSVAGTSVSGTSIFATRMVPGEVMMTAESRCRASTPCDMYIAMMPPETWAMPLVIMTISSERVAFDRNGRIVSGASVWPMKIDAATFMLSAPEMRMVFSITQAMPRMMICIKPMW